MYRSNPTVHRVLMDGRKKALVERLFFEHRGALQAFFRRRIRTLPDASDLAQEVYVRMLRINHIDSIRNPELYMYTVANNLVKEHALADRWRGLAEDIDGPAVQEQLADWPLFDGDIDAGTRTRRLHEVLKELPVKCRATIVLQYRYGLSYQDIGMQLGISAHMVKKYLAQGLAHFRRRMERLR